MTTKPGVQHRCPHCDSSDGYVRIRRGKWYCRKCTTESTVPTAKKAAQKL